MSFDFPILFLVFNRPSTTSRVFEQIRSIRPTRLFVAADGPRANRSDDLENCRAVLDIIETVDWDCQVTKLIRSENLGCGIAVSSAITWFFEQVDRGIILEDDVLPHPTFFSFCAELLDRYADDRRVMSISGTNFFPGFSSESSYHFSRYVGIWGWATWRRAWQGYDFSIHRWRNSDCRARLRKEFLGPQAKFLETIFDGVVTKGVDTWDYQWWFKVLNDDGLSATPSRNLTVNLGFDGGGTHTNNVVEEIRSLPLQSLEGPVKHPIRVVADVQIDRNLARHYYWVAPEALFSWIGGAFFSVLKQLKFLLKGSR